MHLIQRIFSTFHFAGILPFAVMALAGCGEIWSGNGSGISRDVVKLSPYEILYVGVEPECKAQIPNAAPEIYEQGEFYDRNRDGLITKAMNIECLSGLYGDVSEWASDGDVVAMYMQIYRAYPDWDSVCQEPEKVIVALHNVFEAGKEVKGPNNTSRVPEANVIISDIYRRCGLLHPKNYPYDAMYPGVDTLILIYGDVSGE